MPSDRRRENSARYHHGDDSSDDEYRRHRSARPRGYSPKFQRGISENSLIKKEGDAETQDETQWDTDYDPRDRYYLSAEDDPFDPPSIGRRASSRHESSRTRRDREESRDHRRSHHDSPSRSGHTHSRSHGDSQRHTHSPSHSHSREHKDNTVDRHKSSSHPKPSSSAARPRPQPSRASSSYLDSIRRPRTIRAGSSYTTKSRARPRPSRGLSHGSRQAKPKSAHAGPRPRDRLQNINWEEAIKVALQAGTVAAVKVGTDPIPWTKKGTKIASAALGAAVVDHVLQPKKKGGVRYAAMRHLTEMAVGGMVVGPALGKVEARRKR